MIIASFLETGDDVTLKPEFIDRLVLLPKPNANEKIKNVVWMSQIKQKLPMQTSLFWSKEAKEIIDGLIVEEQPEIIIGDMVRCTEYLRDREAYTIADLDDRISLRYKRQVESGISQINPYGAFLNSVPKALQAFIMLKPIRQAVVKKEIKLLSRYELEMGSASNATIFVAEQETKTFNRELGKEKAVTVPLGVDTEYFYYRECDKKDNLIGFLGALNVSHNESAVKHFVSDIFPKVLSDVSDAQFIVIGGGASADLLKLSSDRVTFTGKVDDVRKYLERCKVFVCPMIYGSGVKTKILEAMAIGLPVVTSSIGAENINAIDGSDWVIADKDHEFASNIIDLLLDDNRRLTIGKRAAEFINKYINWDITKKQLERCLSNGCIND